VATVAIVDDNLGVLDALALSLSLDGHRVLCASTPQQALDIVANQPVDVLIQDMNFSRDATSGAEGVALFHALRERAPELKIIVLTAWTQLKSAVELVKAGAADYLGKPWDDAQLRASVNALLAPPRSAPRAAVRERAGVIWASAAMDRVVELALKVAPTALSVLISGPNGVGKERIAQLVQQHSRVAAGPFVTVNAGALPTELIEAELFGSEAGAYTSAHKARSGKFEQADRGTLFLDEIATLPLNGQVKLLRVLETGEITRLGGARPRKVSVRVIAASNADLQEEVRAGRFREDLYYRLNAVELQVPPLAERLDDVQALALRWLEPGRRFSDAALAALLKHSWPGNVRELKNTIARAQLLAAERVIEVVDLGLPAARVEASALNREAIQTVLDAHGGNVSHAALALGLSRQALYRRLKA
jgi:DNA-binding NtrC family response regulator